MARTGKYAHIIDKLERDYGLEPDYQEKVNAIKACLLADLKQHASEFARHYIALRDKKDELENSLSEVNLEIAAVTQLLVDQYEAEGTNTLKLDTGESVRVQEEPMAKVKDRDQFRLWCIENGLERSLALPWQTANALLKERLLKGEPEPDGIEARSRPKIVLTR